MKSPLEPLATMDLRLLTNKTAFLLAVTSTCYAPSDINPSFLQFYKDKVIIFSGVSFSPRIISDFHLNQPIVLPTVLLSPSSDLETLPTLDVHQSSAFYASKTKQIWETNRPIIKNGHLDNLPAFIKMAHQHNQSLLSTVKETAALSSKTALSNLGVKVVKKCFRGMGVVDYLLCVVAFVK